jgi:dGTPase
MENRFYQAFDEESPENWPARPGEYRNVFQINRDRIIHTAAFRRLQSKTQVFFSGEYDFYRTRLTHSIEVAQVGRGICDRLRKTSPFLGPDFHVDADLVEAACLSHDVGHPPFGHAGERKLNELMEPWGGFEGNAQTLRILMHTIFDHGRRGMNPCRALLDSVLKYKTLYSELRKAGGCHPAHHFLYDDQEEVLSFTLGGRDFPLEYPPGRERDAFRSIECDIMDWADDTAYCINDIADGMRAGFLHQDNLQRWAEQRGGSLTPAEEATVAFLLKCLREDKVESRLGRKIGDYIAACSLREDANFVSPATHRHRFRLVVAEEQRLEAAAFKKMALDLVFRSPQLQQMEYKAGLMLERLFEVLRDRYIVAGGRGFRLLPQETERLIAERDTEEGRARAVCDYLANTSDQFAVRLYRRLFDPGFGSLTDLV